MNIEGILSKIFGEPEVKPPAAAPRIPSAAGGTQRKSKLYTANKIVARSAPTSTAQMLGFQPVRSNRAGMNIWRGQLPTRYGNVDAVIESPHKGSYALYLMKLPPQLHGHKCIVAAGNRWTVHLHGQLINLDQFILAASTAL